MSMNSIENDRVEHIEAVGCLSGSRRFAETGCGSAGETRLTTASTKQSQAPAPHANIRRGAGACRTTAHYRVISDTTFKAWTTVPKDAHGPCWCGGANLNKSQYFHQKRTVLPKTPRPLNLDRGRVQVI
jgi:hypothetical protein